MAFVVSGSSLGQQPTPTPSPAEYMPNDPKLDVTAARITGTLAAYNIQQTSQPKMQRAVIAMLDEWVDCGHPEFQSKCLANLAFNATDQPYQNANIHGMSAAGTGMVATDNHMGVASVGGLPSGLEFSPLRFAMVIYANPNGFKPVWRKFWSTSEPAFPLSWLAVTLPVAWLTRWEWTNC